MAAWCNNHESSGTGKHYGGKGGTGWQPGLGKCGMMHQGIAVAVAGCTALCRGSTRVAAQSTIEVAAWVGQQGVWYCEVQCTKGWQWQWQGWWQGATFIKQRGGRVGVAPDGRSTSLVCPELTFHSSFFSSSSLLCLLKICPKHCK